MFKIIAGLIMLCLSVPAAAQSRVGVDGYTFLSKAAQNYNFRVKVVVYKDRAALNAEARKRGLPLATAAFTISPTRIDNTCYIHIVDPYNRYEPEIVGHEIHHCIYGQWHLYNR